jgi:hypothetical protein
MTQPIEVSRANWTKLEKKLRDDYPLSVSLIRGKMKKVLGFTPREYILYSTDARRYTKNCIMLDFFSEKKRTFFIMKYGDYLNER